jgi:hypothetical protein
MAENGSARDQTKQKSEFQSLNLAGYALSMLRLYRPAWTSAAWRAGTTTLARKARSRVNLGTETQASVFV